MFECKEDFRLADEDREDAVRTSTDRVRMAADEEELETSFARVMDLLDQVRRRRGGKKLDKVCKTTERARQNKNLPILRSPLLLHSTGRVPLDRLGASRSGTAVE